MTSEHPPQSNVVKVAVVLLLTLMAVLAGGAARRESVTFDELSHIAAGTSYIQKLDLRLNMEHPPLSKILAGIPVVLRGAKADYTHVSWTFSDQGFFKQYIGQWVFGHYFIATWNDPISTVWWARVSMLVIMLLLGVVLYVYGKRLTTPAGGLLCLCAYATMPAFITFGPLVLSDTVITLFSLLTMWAFADIWQDPSREKMLRFGVALGAAILSKFSAGLLFFCFVMFILSLRFWRLSGMPSDKAELRIWRRRRWGALIKGTLLAASVVYFTYLIFSWRQPTASFSVIPNFPTSLFLRRLLMPIWVFLQGFLTFLVTASRPTFILGHAYSHGVWFYFPVVFLLKSPLAFLALLLVSFVVRMVTKSRLQTGFSPVREGMELHWRAVWTFLFTFFVACVLSRLTISIRHFLTPLALIILLLAPLPRMLQALRNSKWPAAAPSIWLTTVLAVALIVMAIRIYPHYMPFLNSLSMGRPNYELVNDSNMDWNHALPEVSDWAQSRGLQHVRLDAYGFFDPTVYMKQAQLWNCQNPDASDGGQLAVVSAGYILDGHNCRWLLQYPHEALAGGSMYAFRLPGVIPSAGSPGGPPTQADWRNIGGMPGEVDASSLFHSLVQDPQQLQPTWDKFQQYFKEEQERKKAERENSSGR